MTPTIRDLIIVTVLWCGPVTAQTDPTTLSPPDAVAGPTPTAGSDLLPPPVPAMPPAGSDLSPLPPATPPAVSELLPPPSPAASAVTPEEVAALRASFEDLKARAALDAARRQPVTTETMADIDELSAAIAANEGQQQITAWKAQNLAILADQLAAAPAALPSGVPPGTVPQIALAVIAAQTTLYAQPVTDAAGVIRTVADRTTMLRVAEAGAFTLVWAPQDGFAFVLNQFREVF